ncbi:MAG: hypothetical protein JST42_07595 [Bacteroidetes bacterium]|nr:hypothetical protein [Bacteroidota bacterium]
MKDYLVLFREPDGRMQPHSETDIMRHQQNWKAWMTKWGGNGSLSGGNGLTLEGRLIKEGRVSDGIHRVGTEIVGGFLLIKAASMDEAVGIAESCPIYEFGGYAEVREMQGRGGI